MPWKRGAALMVLNLVWITCDCACVKKSHGTNLILFLINFVCYDYSVAQLQFMRQYGILPLCITKLIIKKRFSNSRSLDWKARLKGGRTLCMSWKFNTLNHVERKKTMFIKLKIYMNKQIWINKFGWEEIWWKKFFMCQVLEKKCTIALQVCSTQ